MASKTPGNPTSQGLVDADGNAPSHTPTRGVYGWITHTEISSSDPAATRTWCSNVLGWSFKPGLVGPAGEYHLFTYSDTGGGGIHAGGPAEDLGSVPFIHVADVHTSFAKAVEQGAVAIRPPEKVIEGVCVAVVRAPGGVLIGLSGPTETGG
jgi:predicted enzyme related to lactoylglutathione lyase